MKTMKTGGGTVKMSSGPGPKTKPLAPTGPGPAAKSKMGIHKHRMVENRK